MDSGSAHVRHAATAQTPMSQADHPIANPYRAALRALRRPALLAAGFSAIINVLMLTGSVYMLQVYDRVLGSGSVATLKGLFLIVTLAYVFYGLYEFLRARVLSRAAMRLSGSIAPATFRAWLRSGLDGERAAGLPLRDLEILRGFIASPMMGTLFDLPWIPLYLAVLFAVHPMLGWLTLGGVAVVAVAAWLGRHLTRASIDRGMAEEAAARGFADTGLRNAETIAAMGMTDAVIGRWRMMQNASLATSQQASDITEATSSFSKAFRMFLQSAMLTLGAWLVLGHEISAGMIMAASVISGRLLAPIDQLIAQWKQIGRASVAHARLREFFDDQAQMPEPLGLPAPTGRILATDIVRFAPGTEPGRERRRQIDRVSFALAPGAGLGVIGDSASGKSTLARLLVGACGPDAGELRFDGATRQQWGPAELGRHIGYLPQTVVMLPGTVRDNIRRFSTSQPAKAVIAAAQMAGVHEMILRLPQGYDTMLGGPDQPLSGGQLQRIGLARAIFGQPPIVVLDEPNANLDEAGETALCETIRTLRAQGSTVILMTHRLGILQEMDQILILKQGVAVKCGPRDEVLSSLGLGVVTPPPSAARPVTFLRARVQGSADPITQAVAGTGANSVINNSATSNSVASPVVPSAAPSAATPDTAPAAGPAAADDMTVPFYHRARQATPANGPLVLSPAQRLAAANAAISARGARREG